MPHPDDDVTVLVCDCGKRLRAPGARPGRVGRCPACGGTLRFPGDPAPVASAPKPMMPVRPGELPREIKPKKPKKSVAPIVVGSVPRDIPAANEDVLPERAKPLDVDSRGDLLDRARQVGRGGIFKLPRKSKFGLRDSLLYPFWDLAAITWILIMPFGLAMPYLIVFYMIPVVLQGGVWSIMLPIVFPMIVVLGVALGYLGLIFSEVLAESSANEVHHPRWPEIDFGAIVGSLFRWSCGLVIGLGLGAIPAMQFWKRAEEHGLGDRVIASGLVACGLLYGLMSLASLILHGDLLALNPVMIIKAIFRGGFPYLQTVWLAICVVMVSTVALEMINRAYGEFLMLPAAWLAWAWIVYGGTVVSRSLGMTLHTRRKQIGWFPDRERWGASMDGIDPSLFRDKDGRRVS